MNNKLIIYQNKLIILSKIKKMKIIFVEGNIGSGKSSFLNKISDYVKKNNLQKIKCIQEPVDIWKNMIDKEGKNILEYFYEDPKRNCYMFQTFAFISRLEHLDNLQDDYTYIIERSVLSDKNIFALNCYETDLMTHMEWLTYNTWFDWMHTKYSHVFNKSKFLYIQCEPEISFERIQKRNRMEEKDISLDYIKLIHSKHEDWLVKNTNTNVIIVDGKQNLLDDQIFKEFMNNFIHQL